MTQYSWIHNIIKMYKFDLWYIYYDSLFLSANPKLPYFLTKKHSFVSWPKTQPIQLSQGFQKLQSFIKSEDSWYPSSCTSLELRQIEDNLNNLLIFLQIEKQYAEQFWPTDQRRIQASVTHLYMFLQIFIKSIIPYPTMTIFQCKAANKLCVSMNQLQKLINFILKILNPLYKFLQRETFHEQMILTKSFFQNWVQLVKKMPNIRRDKFNHLPQIIRIVNLNNEIMMWDVKPEKKKKSLENINLNKLFHRHKSLYKFSSSEMPKYFNETAYNVPIKSLSCFGKIWDKKVNENKEIKRKLFKFSEEISNFSITQKKQFFQDTGDLLEEQTPTKIRRITQRMKKSQTIGNYENNSGSKAKKITPPRNNRIKTTFVATQQIHTHQKSKNKYIERSQRTTRTTISKANEHQEQRLQKGKVEKNQKKEKVLLKIEQQVKLVHEKDNKKNLYLNLETGERVCRGWELVRKYVKERIARRKLSKIRLQ